MFVISGILTKIFLQAVEVYNLVDIMFQLVSFQESRFLNQFLDPRIKILESDHLKLEISHVKTPNSEGFIQWRSLLSMSSYIICWYLSNHSCQTTHQEQTSQQPDYYYHGSGLSFSTMQSTTFARV